MPAKLYIKLNIDQVDLNGPIESVIERLQQNLDSVPSEYRASVTMRVEGDCDTSDVDVTAYYERDETAEEKLAREAQMGAQMRARLESTRRAELATLAALKAKYPDVSSF